MICEFLHRVSFLVLAGFALTAAAATPFIAFSAIPTVEGLFRNGNNRDIQGKIFVIQAVISSLESERALETLEALKGEGQQLHIKMIFSKRRKGKMGMLQLLYDSSSMKGEHLREVFFAPHILSKMKKDDRPSRLLFYSLILMYSFNDSTGIKALFKRYVGDFRSNDEIMDRNKIALYQRYRNYLLAIKKDKSLKKELISPLRPGDRREREKVRKLITSPMYKDINALKLIRQGNQFYWQVRLGQLNALFSNETHSLKSLTLRTPRGTVQVKAGHYTLLNKRYEWPHILLFRDEFFKFTHLQITKVKVYNTLSKRLFQLAKGHVDTLKKSRSSRHRQRHQEQRSQNVALLYYPL